MMVTPEGIRVELTVSTGTVFTAVPDVVNIDYREAKNRLQQAGFQVEIENATSNSVTKDYVISTESRRERPAQRRLDRVCDRSSGA